MGTCVNGCPCVRNHVHVCRHVVSCRHMSVLSVPMWKYVSVLAMCAPTCEYLCIFTRMPTSLLDTVLLSVSSRSSPYLAVAPVPVLTVSFHSRAYICRHTVKVGHPCICTKHIHQCICGRLGSLSTLICQYRVWAPPFALGSELSSSPA